MENVKRCAFCGEIIEEGSSFYTFNDNGEMQYCCNECEEEGRIWYCDYCEEWHSNNIDNYYVNNDDMYVCQKAIDNGDYKLCEECQELFHVGDMIDTENGYVCVHCYDNYYYTCSRCGRVERGDYGHYIEDEDTYLCDSCYDVWLEENGSKYINEYHYGDEDIKYNPQRMGGEDIDVCYFGIEVENEGNRKDAEYVHDNLSDLFTMENDGSLDNGFEMISAPLSLNKWYNVSDRVRNVFNELINRGHKAHDTSTCGLHIHLSIKAFKNTDAIKRYVAIINVLQDDFKLLARRDSSDYLEYSYFSKVDKSFIDISELGHYSAVNVRKETIETRIFRGTLKFDTILASIELLNNVLKIANSDKKRIYFYEFLEGRYLSNYVMDINKNKYIKYDDVIDFGGWCAYETKKLLRSKRNIKNDIKEMNELLQTRGLAPISI